MVSSFLLVVSFVITIKFHFEFNENRKFHDLKGVNLKKEFTTQRGFCCTTKNKNIAIDFAQSKNDKNDNEDKKISVLLKIKINSEYNFFVLDTDEYHAFPCEEEVLL